LTSLGTRIERLAKQQSEPSIGAQVAAILDGKDPEARLSDEDLARTRTGRLLLERRRRAEASYPS
jgi:hypothetical protein